MKKTYYILLLFFILSCSESKFDFKSNWQTNNNINKNQINFKIITENFTQSNPSTNLNIEIKYPQIDNYLNIRSQKAFNKMIQSLVLGIINTYKIGFKSRQNKRIESSANYLRSKYEINYTSTNSISLMIYTTYKYSYDTTIFENTKSINYSLIDNSQIQLADLFPSDTNYIYLISKLSRKMIIKNRRLDSNWINSGIRPNIDNFRNFNINKNNLIITFSKYQIDPKSKHSTRIELPFEYFVNLKQRLNMIYK